MTDPSAPAPSPAPDPTVVSPVALNGLCETAEPRQPNTESPGDTFHMDQQMKISDVEDKDLLESSLRLKPHEAQSYRKKALWVSWVSIVVTLILAIAFDAILDVLSSIIVIWRYSNAAAVHSAHREYIACVILGVVFILSALTILVKAIHALATKVLPEVDDFLYSVSVISGVACVILAIVKCMLGKVLTSRALITDGFNSLVGGVMGFSILISAEVFKHNPKVWFLDGTIGVLIGLTILTYGLKLLVDMVPRVRQTRHYERFE
uniref:Uncharacterized protein n=1 Tax=Electrophorus electricus TaxID=8005 RepID=A0A4W4HPI7_ELEEL